MIAKIVLALLSVASVYAQLATDARSATLVSTTHQNIAQQCFGCICEAASNCNLKIGCHDGVCGPFSITWAYWADSGKPTLNNQSPDRPDAYSDCANDITCAAKTVQEFMNRYAQDCNGDGVINCDDYVRLHRLGGYGCSGLVEPAYMGKYQSCMNYVNNL